MAYQQVFKYIFMLLIFTASTNSFALSNHGYALDYVQGEGDVKGLKLAYQYHAPQLQSILKNTHIYLESSFNFGSTALKISIKPT